MFILGNLLYALAVVLNIFLTLYMILVIARAVISWVNPDPYNPIVQFLYRSTEPVLRRVRAVLPFGAVGIDFSPLIVILGIYFLKIFLVQSLLQISYRLRF
ncbi:MAG: YggT family protein [Deltaproteobacteria bacterium]|nr:MAG: YggT family protein [Deltaproteobacteria bacterium]